jgi:hypothetical protein
MRKLFKVTAVLFLLSLVATKGFGQDTRPAKVKQKSGNKIFSFQKDSLYYGGNIGLQFSTGGSLIDLSPNVGYKLIKYVSVGVQGIFTNISYKYGGPGGLTERYTFYGGGVFVRVKPINWLFLQAEYDVLSVPDNFSFGVAKKRTIADVNLAGLGLRNQLGENSSYYLLLMYEFVPTPNSPYSYGPFNSPLVYRAGFNINF